MFNEDRLVAVSVMGHIVQPSFPGLPAEPYRLAADGTPFLLPTYGGIVYNVSVGDSAYGWLADCVHPGVSISFPNENGNRGLNVFACVGNQAVVMSGEGKGSKGVVTGKSGRFSEHVIVHFPKADRKKFAINDKIVIRSCGVGMGAGRSSRYQAEEPFSGTAAGIESSVIGGELAGPSGGQGSRSPDRRGCWVDQRRRQPAHPNHRSHRDRRTRGSISFGWVTWLRSRTMTAVTSMDIFAGRPASR